MNKNYTIAFDLSDEDVSVLKNSNDDIYDVSDLQFESSIYFVTSAFKVRIYEEEIDRRAESCLTFDADHAFSQVHQTQNDSDQVNSFFFFNNSIDYDLTL
jgi:hypothetical protein